ncbi:MAG: hypothetical protein M0R77_14540 [Gammaproteobacteria bacterium]|nr:hypothetical protein [Gammaproteobacteria bacterium]
MAGLRRLLPGVIAWLACSAPATAELRDLYFGEALYQAHQGRWFDAVARLDNELGQHYGVDERQLDSLHLHVDDAEFSVGDFELSYRMHNRAGRAITAVLEANVAPEVRNEAAWRLARVYFQKERPVEALHALERIQGPVPARIRDDVAFLRAQVLIANGRLSDAIAILEDLRDAKGFEGFAAYNLGIALYKAGRLKEAGVELARAGLIGGDDKGDQAIRDKANLVLGTRLLEAEDYAGAQTFLERVRLTGPFSNRALLSAGWAHASQEHYERAIVPWTLLAARNITDRTVPEALLALPYAYGKLEVHGKAALLYGQALESFGNELTRLDASIRSIREGRFLRALVREELAQDSDWVIKLRELPDAPETWYLTELMASHDFQQSLRNYLDLEDLRRRTAEWDVQINAWEQLVQTRRAYYEPLLPDIDRQFRLLDSRIKLRLEQRDLIHKRLQSMLVMPRPDLLVTAQEREAREALAALEREAGTDARVRDRVARLQGVLHWNIHTDYDNRLTTAHKHLRQLDQEIVHLKTGHQAFIRSRQAATQSYQGYENTLRQLRLRSRDANEKITRLMARQGSLLEAMAVEELDRRRARLEEQQVKARFALADSYDRVSRQQEAERAAK